jgi:homoserine dehydrogenase
MKKLNIGLLGYGTVGKGVHHVLNNTENMTLHAVFRRSGKATEALMTDDYESLINDPAIDTIVEAMGGLEPAYFFLKQALLKGKNVVTANKALVNAYGDELNRMAIQNNVSFLFSAACGGGIPYLPSLILAQQKETILAVGGILNGTTNFIIDKMEREKLSFEEALTQAQTLGYAEADPSGDLNGTDTMYKLRLALAVGLETWAELDSIDVAGIQVLKDIDIRIFEKKQWKLRLMCFGKLEKGSLSAYVEPTLVGDTDPEAFITENNNLAWFETASHQKTSLKGQGAGSIPTATNVLRDLETILDHGGRMLKENITSKKANNNTENHTYYVRTPLSVQSSFLDQHQASAWVEGTSRFTLTTSVPVSLMHQEMKKLSQESEVFFASIRQGVHHESL